MRKHGNARGRLMVGNTGQLDFKLALILFEEDGATICYCPALDLSGYGHNEAEANESFKLVMKEYFDYTFKKKTLLTDLRRLGWKVKNSVAKKMHPPTDTQLLERNEEFRRVFNNYPYKKTTTPVHIPAFT